MTSTGLIRHSTNPAIQPQQTCTAPASVMAVAFPAGRTALYVNEVAKLWRCTNKHVAELIEETKLGAVDISGGEDVAELLVKSLANKLRTQPNIIRQALAEARKHIGRGRKYWRIGKTDFESFMIRNSNLA